MVGRSGLAPGTVIGGDLTIVSPLSHGGMGAVYLAEQASTGKRRALKVIHPEIVADPIIRRRFEQEARVGARIRSEHVVDVVAAGVDGPTGLPYLVMELLEGEDLRRYLDTHAEVSVGTVRAIFEQLSHAVGAAHAAGVVHRDLKPENIFLALSQRAGAGGFTVKVLDFGIAKLVAEAGTQSTQGGIGSPMWMAPEQTAPGDVGPAADVWALGLIAYALFTRKNYWRSANDAQATPSQLLREIVLDPLPPASARAAEMGALGRVPPGFDGWFERCVARDPAARFPHAGLAWEAMRAIFGGGTRASQRPPPPSVDLDRPTAEATPFSLQPSSEARSAPRPSAPQHETPIATVQHAGVQATAAPAQPASRATMYLAGAIAVAGIAIGWGLSQRAKEAPALQAQLPASAEVPVPASTAAPSPSATAATTIAALPSAALSADSPPAAVVPSAVPFAALAKASPPNGLSASAALPPVAPRPRPSAPVAAATTASAASGFADPKDAASERKGATTWKVGEHHVRLLTQMMSNASNVADAVVKKAVEWNSWQYLRCYERNFSGLKDMPEATVVVGFDILDQLPRFGVLQSTTSPTKSFNDCVVGTLLGQTINAAGPDGKGHVVYAFRFLP